MRSILELQRGFLDELEKIAKKQKKPDVDKRRGWVVPASRKGRRSMRVATLLRKEKDGTLGGFKFAQILEAFQKVGNEYVMQESEEGPVPPAPPKRREFPSKDNREGQRREDNRAEAATIHSSASEIMVNS